LEPLDRSYPQHPGIPHYLIHAYDNAELAPKGLAAAKAYVQIAPSAPHALHMPSHIFTRLGLWDDSITSNLAAKQAKVKFLGSYPVAGAVGHQRRKAATKAWRDANTWLGGLREQIRHEERFLELLGAPPDPEGSAAAHRVVDAGGPP